MNLEQLNILGNDIVFLGSGFLAEAAVKEAKTKNIEDTELQEELEATATKFNIWGNWLTLIGDFLLAIAASLVVQDSSNAGQEDESGGSTSDAVVKSEALELDLLGSWGNVVSDYLSVLAAELEASTK